MFLIWPLMDIYWTVVPLFFIDFGQFLKHHILCDIIAAKRVRKMFKDKLKKLRKEQNMTQAEMARRLGTSASAVGMYEQGRRQPDSETLARMAELLHCTTDELLDVGRPSDVNDAIDSFARTLERQPGLMFHGAPLTKSDREKLVNAIRIAAAISSQKP